MFSNRLMIQTLRSISLVLAVIAGCAGLLWPISIFEALIVSPLVSLALLSLWGYLGCQLNQKTRNAQIHRLTFKQEAILSGHDKAA